MVNDTLMTRYLHSVRGLGRADSVSACSAVMSWWVLMEVPTSGDFISNYKTGRSALANNKNIYTSRILAASTINQSVISRRADRRPLPLAARGLFRSSNASIPQNKIPYMCHMYDGLESQQTAMATKTGRLSSNKTRGKAAVWERGATDTRTECPEC